MIRETEIDGVPTLFVHRAGPLRAGLVFRVGRSDETLPTTGVTHLVEHLALYRQGLADYHYNGATAMWYTTFAVQGTGEHVTGYLSSVCEALTDLPLDRLDTEKSILRTEAQSRANGGVMQRMRYGARGQGLVGYGEWGLYRLGGEEVAAWARNWFTRENAMLWVTGEEIPAGVRLSLPSGTRMPVPPLVSVIGQTPAYLADGGGGMAFSAVVPRGAAASVFTTVLERQLFRSLRQQGGLSYTTEADYNVQPDGSAEIAALADALPDKQDAVVGEFVDVLARLDAGRVEPADLAAHRTKALQTLDHPDFEAATLPGRVADLLSGRPSEPVELLREQLEAVTVEQVAQVAKEALGSGLVWVPRGHRLDWAGFEPVTMSSRFETPAARRFPARSADGRELIVGPEGVSYVSPDRRSTVPFKSCAAMLVWPDGGRRLIGEDGFAVPLEPTVFDIDPAALAAVDAGVPPTAVIPMPPREPEAIPQPSAPSPAPTRPGLPVRNTILSWIVTGILVAVTCMMGESVSEWWPAEPDRQDRTMILVLIPTLASLVVSLGLYIRLMVRIRERRRAG